MPDKTNNGDKLTDFFAEHLNLEELVAARELAKISAKISSIRIEKNMTQKEFADFIGVSQGMVAKWESDDYNFTISTLVKILTKLGYDIEIIFKSKEPKYDNISKLEPKSWNEGPEDFADEGPSFSIKLNETVNTFSFGDEVKEEKPKEE